MLSDKTVKGLEIVLPENVDIDEDIVNIKGKIGETTNLRERIKMYKTFKGNNGMYRRFQGV
jgi:hypothetical protein